MKDLWNSQKRIREYKKILKSYMRKLNRNLEKRFIESWRYHTRFRKSLELKTVGSWEFSRDVLCILTLLFSGNLLWPIGDKMLNTADPRLWESLVWIFGTIFPFQWDALNLSTLLPKQRQGNGCLHILGISQNHHMTHLHHALVLSTVSDFTCTEQICMA